MKIIKYVTGNLIVVILFFGITLILFNSCKTRNTKPGSSNFSEFVVSDSDTLFASLDRNPCFGRCPTYQFFLYGSGYALYKGKMEVARIGTYEARFTKEQMQLFLDAAIENRVDTLQSEYVNPQIADFPATFSSIVIKGNRHSFHVSTDTPPPSLTEFEITVERLLEMPKWRKISDSTE